MSSVPRRTIPELVFLHEREVSIKDIFVEGTYDASIILSYLHDLGNPKTAVRLIETIEIDDQKLIDAGRDANNRERVIYLAERFEREFETDGKILCVVDRDFVDHLGTAVEARDLIYTDGSCMEMYLWHENSFSRFLTVYCNKPEWTAKKVLASIRYPLEAMYALRLAGRMLDLKLDWIDKNVCVKCTNWSVDLDLESLAKRHLLKISKVEYLDELIEKTKQNIYGFSSDPRKQIHGHDFWRVLVFFLKKRGVSKVSLDRRTIARAMALTPTKEELEAEPLFASIEKFAVAAV